MKKIISAVGVSKLDIINSETSASYKELVGKTEQVTGAAIVQEPDAETGDLKEYSYLYTKNGVYAGNSATVRRAIDGLIDLLTEEPVDLTVTAESRPTKSGREFLTVRFEVVQDKK